LLNGSEEDEDAPNIARKDSLTNQIQMESKGGLKRMVKSNKGGIIMKTPKTEKFFRKMIMKKR